MKLIYIGNGCFFRKSEETLVNPQLVDMMQEFAKYFESIVYGEVLFDRDSYPANYIEFRPGAAPIELLPIRRHGDTKMARLFWYLRAVPEIIRNIRQSDCLYTSFPGAIGLFACLCAVVLRRPYGVFLAGQRDIQTRRAQLIFSHARFVLTAGPGLLLDKARRYCVDVDVAPPIFDLTMEDRVITREFREKPPWTILFVGRVETKKGIDELVEAASILKNRNIAFKIKLVGVELKMMPSSRAKMCGELAGFIEHLGPISDRARIKQLFETADLFILPSHEEGFPRVLYEAMIFQTPIVTTFVGSIGAVMQDRRNCLEVPVRDASALAATMEEALADSDLRRRIAGRAGDTVAQIFERWRGETHSAAVYRKMKQYVS